MLASMPASVNQQGRLALVPLVNPDHTEAYMALGKTIICAAIAAGALALSGASESAAIACNGSVCWHVRDHYRYPARAHIMIHEDHWRAGPHIVFREHRGRGYWRGRTWVEW